MYDSVFDALRGKNINIKSLLGFGTEWDIRYNNRGCVTLPFGPKGGTDPIKPFEITTYKDFTVRSEVGDGLEGHEMWQHANINENGYATARMSTDVSKDNPVIALPHDIHTDVNRQQHLYDARSQTPYENIISNANIMYNNKDIPNDQVTKHLIGALKHLDGIGGN